MKVALELPLRNTRCAIPANTISYVLCRHLAGTLARVCPITSCILSQPSVDLTSEIITTPSRMQLLVPTSHSLYYNHLLFIAIMYDRAFTSERIEELGEHEIFVFGSNLEGSHGGGAALIAFRKFGAIWGQGVGLQGQSYGIPTMQGGVETIRPYTDQFIEFAKNHPEYTFLVTRIGCGIAGFDDSEIAPLFAEALDVSNIILPKSFVQNLE